MALVDLASYKVYLGTSSSSGNDSLLQACLDAAESEVLHFCRRSTAFTGFEQSTGLTRYYRAEDIIELPIGSQYQVAGIKSWDRWGGTVWAPNSKTALWFGDADLLAITGITNGDETTISSTSYWLEPRNAGRSGQPYRYLRLRSDESWVFNTDGEVSITGTWGYSTGPDGTIVNAVKETARFVLNLRDSQVFDVTASPEIGVITVPKGMPQHVKVALSNGGYIRTQGFY